MSKHTPGPWLLDDEGQIYSHAAHIATVNTPYDASENLWDWDQTMTNGALLAAAPDLQAAVMGLLAEYEFDEGNPGRRKAFLNARLALAKSEGK